jgi:hypothetical protein
MNTYLSKANTYLTALAIVAAIATGASAQQPQNAPAGEEILATSTTNKLTIAGGPGWCSPDKPAQMTMTVGAGSPLSSTAQIIEYAGRLRLSVLAAQCPSAQAAIVTVKPASRPDFVLAARAPNYEFRQVESAVDAATRLERPAPAGVDLDDGSLVNGVTISLIKHVGSTTVEIGDYKILDAAPVALTLRKTLEKLLPTAAFPRDSRFSVRLSGKLVVTSPTPTPALLSLDLTSPSQGSPDFVCSSGATMDGKPIVDLSLSNKGTKLADVAPVLAAGIHDFVLAITCVTKDDVVVADRAKTQGFMDAVVTVQGKLPGERNQRPLKYNDLMTTPPAETTTSTEPAPTTAPTAPKNP